MPQGLQAVSVLIVEDDEDAGELLAEGLRGHGATVRLEATGAAALRALADAPPDVVLCDLGLPDGSGHDWLARFRAARPAVPAIALSGYGSAADRERSLVAGFETHLIKPARLVDIATAVRIVARPQALQAVLARLAALTGCRYTSLLRFDGELLTSVWTHDRESPRFDPFPLGLPVEASYCVLVRRTGAALAIEDAAQDPRAAGHPKQRELASYLAEPIFRANGELFGTLCSYDAAPRAFTSAARAALIGAARALERALHDDALIG